MTHDKSIQTVNVLVVEDNDDLRSLFKRSLQRHGFQVRLATNGLEALTALAEER